MYKTNTKVKKNNNNNKKDKTVVPFKTCFIPLTALSESVPIFLMIIIRSS